MLQNTYKRTTPRQAREEPAIFEGMNKRKLNGIAKHDAKMITDLDVMINDDIAMLEAEMQLWKLHADERIIVKIESNYNPN